MHKHTSRNVREFLLLKSTLPPIPHTGGKEKPNTGQNQEINEYHDHVPFSHKKLETQKQENLLLSRFSHYGLQQQITKHTFSTPHSYSGSQLS
jgi:hypothetical protein